MINKLNSLNETTPQKLNQIIDRINLLEEVRAYTPLQVTRANGSIQISYPSSYYQSSNYFNDNLNGAPYNDGLKLSSISFTGANNPAVADGTSPGLLLSPLPHSTKGGQVLPSTTLTIPAGSGEVEVRGLLTCYHNFTATGFAGRWWAYAVPYAISGLPGTGSGDLTTAIEFAHAQVVPVEAPPNLVIPTPGGVPTPTTITCVNYQTGSAFGTLPTIQGAFGQAHCYVRLPNFDNEVVIGWAVNACVYGAGYLSGSFSGAYSLTTTLNHNYLQYEALNISQSQPVPPSPATVPPWIVATITPTTATGAHPFTVNFTLSYTGNRGAVSFFWFFGDGGTSTAQNPSHTYTTAGTYCSLVYVSDGDTYPSVSTVCYFTITVT